MNFLCRYLLKNAEERQIGLSLLVNFPPNLFSGTSSSISGAGANGIQGDSDCEEGGFVHIIQSCLVRSPALSAFTLTWQCRCTSRGLQHQCWISTFYAKPEMLLCSCLRCTRNPISRTELLQKKLIVGHAMDSVSHCQLSPDCILRYKNRMPILKQDKFTASKTCCSVRLQHRFLQQGLTVLEICWKSV